MRYWYRNRDKYDVTPSEWVRYLKIYRLLREAERATDDRGKNDSIISVVIWDSMMAHRRIKR